MFEKKKEVFLTNNTESYVKVCQILKKEGISYTTKIVNSGSQNRASGEFWGKLGENAEREILYYIYVFAKEEEKAKYVISEYQKNPHF